MRKTKLLTSLLGLAGLSSLITPALASCSVNSEDIVHEEYNVSLAKNIQDKYKMSVSRIRKGHDLFVRINPIDKSIGWNGNKVNVKVDGSSISSKEYKFEGDNLKDGMTPSYKLFIPSEKITGDVVISIPTSEIVPIYCETSWNYESYVTIGSEGAITAENFYGDHEITMTTHDLSGDDFVIIANNIYYGEPGSDYLPNNDDHHLTSDSSYWYTKQTGTTSKINIHFSKKDRWSYNPDFLLEIDYSCCDFNQSKTCKLNVRGLNENESMLMYDPKWTDYNQYTYSSEGLDENQWYGQDITVNLTKNVDPELRFFKTSAVITVGTSEETWTTLDPNEYSVELLKNNRSIKISFSQNFKSNIVLWLSDHDIEAGLEIDVDFMIGREWIGSWETLPNHEICHNDNSEYCPEGTAVLYDEDDNPINSFSVSDFWFRYRTMGYDNYVTWTLKLDHPDICYIDYDFLESPEIKLGAHYYDGGEPQEEPFFTKDIIDSNYGYTEIWFKINTNAFLAIYNKIQDWMLIETLDAICMDIGFGADYI